MPRRAARQWFNACLGASDLAYLTRQTEPNTNHLDKIRAALFALPSDSVERHVSAFGKGLTESINTLKAELKPRYLRAGIRIVGDHESAAEARKLAMYYDDLLQEITLDVRVDGETIERAGSFTAVPGIGGMLMGSTALAAAISRSLFTRSAGT